jgi:4-carboxymuconolactone decarboxylase
MVRVPLPGREQLSGDAQAVYDRIEKSRGGVGNIWRALLNAPGLADRILGLADELRHGTTIDKHTRELAVLTVGSVTKCDYEFDHHWNAALKVGIPRAKLEALSAFETSPVFEERERAVMRFAKEATEVGTVKDATWDALRKHFETPQAMEILLTVAWYNTVVRILLPLNIENEPDFKRQ